MLSSRKNERANSSKNSRQKDKHYSKDPSGQGGGSYKRTSQLRGIAVDKKNKIQFTSAFHTSLT